MSRIATDMWAAFYPPARWGSQVVMSEPEPERFVEELEERTQALQDELRRVREDWGRKRRDQSIPGAPPPDDAGEEEPEESPAPEAPPPEAGPSEAEVPPEG